MNQRTKSTQVRKLATMAVLCALAYIVMLVGRIPISSVEFLKYDPKDVIIAFGAFIYGPFPAFLMSVVVSVLEMITVSSTGPIGMVMNILSTCAFACTAGIIYKRKQTISGAIIGLVAGVVAMTGVMLLWNYLVTPLYQGVPREAIATMLVPVFLPFNLIKSCINAALTLILYKPLVTGLRKARLLPPSSGSGQAAGQKTKLNAGVIIAALLVLITCVLVILVIRGII